MPLGLDYGLIAAVCWGSTDVMGTIGSRRLGSLRVIAIAQVASLGIALLVALVMGSGLPTDPLVLLASGLMGVVAAGAYLSFFTALRIGPLAVVSPVVAAYGGITVLLAVVLRGESLNGIQAVGALLATLGVVLTGLIFEGGWRGTRIVGRGVIFSVIAMLLFAVLTIGMAGPIQVAGWLPVLLASRVANAATIWIVLAIVIVAKPRGSETLLAAPSVRSRRAVLAALVAGALDIVGFVAFAIGLEVAPTWIVGLASSFGPVVAVVVAVALWGERLRPTQWLGLAGIAAGLVAVALP